MWALYLACLLPIFIGGVLFVLNKKIVWWEWLIGSCAGFLVAGIVHFTAFKSQTSDFETLSGQIVDCRKFSAWQEFYFEAIYKTETYTTGFGKNRQTHTRRVFSHWSPRTRWHSEYFVAYSNIGPVLILMATNILIGNKNGITKRVLLATVAPWNMALGKLAATL